MFELGRDLRKLFAQARDSEDLSWLELIGVDLLEIEARQQTTDAGRVSCPDPFRAWLRASAFWREHARRTGRADSLKRALETVEDAARAARSADETDQVRLAEAQAHLLTFDLCGGFAALGQANDAVVSVGRPRKRDTAAAAGALHAQIRARQARLDGRAGGLLDAAALLDAALHDLVGRPQGELDEIRMDRAGLTLQAGVIQRDARLLDQAGRDLRALVESSSAEQRPLTRARSLALCGAGLCALAAIAANDEAMRQGREMFRAAADQFTADHSPLDWVAIQLVRANSGDAPSLLAITEAEDLTAGQALVLGAMARERRVAHAVAVAEAAVGLEALETIENRVRRRLANRAGQAAPLDWAADQISMAHIELARRRLTGGPGGALSLALVEAAEVAREMGAPMLAARAEQQLVCLAAV